MYWLLHCTYDKTLSCACVGACACTCAGAGNDLQQNLQKELEAKLSKFRKATFTPSAAADAKLAAAE